MLVIACVWVILPRVDPISLGFIGFRRVYDFVIFLIVSFLAYIHALILGINLGWNLNMLDMLLGGLGILIFVIGALLPQLKRNWFIGIRTPWTITSDYVWNKTHKLGSILFELSGILMFIAGFNFGPTLTAWLAIAPVVFTIIVAVIYSYIVFRHRALP